MDERIGMPDVIPDDLPPGVMMMVLMLAPSLMDGVDVDDLAPGSVVGHGRLAGGIQVQLNCPLELAVIGLRGLLAKMEQDVARLHAAENN